MDPYGIPPLQIDPGILPPVILTSEPDSFAQNTFKIRVPRIIEETIEDNSFPLDVVRALQELRSEIVSGKIRALREETPDKVFWQGASRDCIGKSWLDAPWYWAETYFYRRILEATRYFQPGPLQGYDPYSPKKNADLHPDAAPHAVNTTLGNLPTDARERFRVLLYASLWGNRADLSMFDRFEITRISANQDDRANLVVDDSMSVWKFLQAHTRGPVAIIADNAGTELMHDLALADLLLSESLAAPVTLHLKPQPFFVSDAMPKDVEASVDALSRGADLTRALATRLRGHLAAGRLQMRTHWFYPSSLFYFQLPDDLRADLAAMNLVIIKGDANYRRLLGDAHWSPTFPFERATAYFPAPFASLRTLKAELIVGLRHGESDRLRAQDPEWLVNGRRGVIQARLIFS